MRILLASETYFPVISGVVIFTQNLAEELTSRGHEVAIFAPSTNGLYQVQKKNGITIYRFPSLPNPFRPKARIVIQQYGKVRTAFKEFNPDVVHLQTPSGVAHATLKSARRQGVPVVATQHFLIEFILLYLKPLAFLSPLTNRALVLYLNRFFSQCTYITCPTESIKKALLQDGIEADLHVVSNGIRLEKFRQKPRTIWSKIPRDRQVVLHVGRLDQDKNIPLLLEAIPQVLNVLPTTYFVLAGSGNHLKKAKQWAQENNLEGSLFLVGKVPHGSPHMHQLYHQAEVFVIPSNIETQSLVTMEAIASGLPVVAADAGALPELVHHKENGLLVKPNSPDALAQALITVLSNTEMRDKMKENGKSIIEEHNLPSVVDTFLSIYQTVMKK
jgi:glycosyltransferase involved in cell wall biosynthesis